MEYTIKYSGVIPHVADKIEMGAVLYTSWGYDQTNIDYYVVVEISKSMCKILPMTQKMTRAGHDSLSEYVTATKNIDFAGELERKKIQTASWNGGSQYLRIASYASAYLWDGKERFQSHYH